MREYVKIDRLAKVFGCKRERITKALEVNTDKKSIKRSTAWDLLEADPDVLESVLSRDDTLLNITKLKSFVTEQTGITPDAVNQIQTVGALLFNATAKVGGNFYYSKNEILDSGFLKDLKRRSKKINRAVLSKPETIATGFGNLLAEF